MHYHCSSFYAKSSQAIFIEQQTHILYHCVMCGALHRTMRQSTTIDITLYAVQNITQIRLNVTFTITN